MQTSTVAGFWTFTVVAAVVTATGTLVGHFLKEVVLDRSLETWKRRETIREIQRKYRDPIILAATELAQRLNEILKQYPTDFLDRAVLIGTPARTHGSHRDAYFQRYKCQSTIYRLAAVLGWLELYRQELVFMDAETQKAERSIERCLHALREDLADGTLNEAADWSTWKDALIFREEQRAIGEAMIIGIVSTRTVMSYGAFIAAAEAPEHPSNRWIRVAEHFCIDVETAKDFRRTRLQRLLVHLMDLVRTLDASRAEQWLADVAQKHRLALAKAGQKGFNAASGLTALTS